MTACELAGVTRRTIYNWLAANKLEYVRTPGGSVRIYTDTLFRAGNVDPVTGERRRAD
jgi:excisionase family DNA binding protein